MLATASYQDVHTDLAQALQQFWDEYAAIRPARVRVVSGEGAIVVLLEEVLSPAERQMAGAQEGRKMLQELGERILEQARPHLRQLVADTVGQEDIQVEVHLDAAGGNLVGFFRLG